MSSVAVSDEVDERAANNGKPGAPPNCPINKLSERLSIVSDPVVYRSRGRSNPTAGEPVCFIYTRGDVAEDVALVERFSFVRKSTVAPVRQATKAYFKLCSAKPQGDHSNIPRNSRKRMSTTLKKKKNTDTYMFTSR